MPDKPQGLSPTKTPKYKDDRRRMPPLLLRWESHQENLPCPLLPTSQGSGVLGCITPISCQLPLLAGDVGTLGDVPKATCPQVPTATAWSLSYHWLLIASPSPRGGTHDIRAATMYFMEGQVPVTSCAGFVPKTCEGQAVLSPLPRHGEPWSCLRHQHLSCPVQLGSDPLI